MWAWPSSPTTGWSSSLRSSARGRSRPRPFESSTCPEPGAEVPGELRQADALLAVLDGFSDGADPASDLETLRLELIVADRDHVERRLEKVRKEAKSGERAQRLEVEQLEKLLAHLEAGKPLSEWRGELPAALEPLTTKPLIPVENGPDASTARSRWSSPSSPAEDAAEFRTGPSALDDVVRRLKEALGLITFYTVGDTEARAWTLRARRDRAGRRGVDPHRHRARVHPREVIRWDDLARVRLACRGRPARPATSRGEDLRRRGR